MADRISICPLGSGSRGNCLYIGTPQGAILIDAGFSTRETLKRIARAGLTPFGIHGVLITHEHGDHVRGVVSLARQLGITVFISRPTHRALRGVSFPRVHHFTSGETFDAGPFSVEAVPLSHDAADPVAFVVAWGGWAVGCVTDLGVPTQSVAERLRRCDFLLCEANHDEEMLLNGPYPWPVKQRIRGRHGHLSNLQGLALLEGMLHPGLQGVVLAHLSEKCNRPELAYGVFSSRLRALGAGDLPLWTASQDEPLSGISIDAL